MSPLSERRPTLCTLSLCLCTVVKCTRFDFVRLLLFSRWHDLRGARFQTSDCRHCDAASRRDLEKLSDYRLLRTEHTDRISHIRVLQTPLHISLIHEQHLVPLLRPSWLNADSSSSTSALLLSHAKLFVSSPGIRLRCRIAIRISLWPDSSRTLPSLLHLCLVVYPYHGSSRPQLPPTIAINVLFTHAAALNINRNLPSQPQ